MLKSHDGSRSSAATPASRRFACILARDSTATQLLHGCQVVNASGEVLGCVTSILVDASSRQLRYVLASRRSGSATVAIPWHALYFDSSSARLVFYTCN